MKARGLQTPPTTGARVRLTGYFLACTGQRTGREGSKVWTVLGASGDFVIVDEELEGYRETFTPAELAADPSLRWRRIHRGNLQIVGAHPRAADQPEECPPVKQWGQP